MMKLKKLINNTWYLDDWQIIPLYMISEHTCILLDSGLLSQREAIEQTLAKHQIRPEGIIGSHVHTDHSANHFYFQQKYQIPVILSVGEAGIASGTLNLKSYYYMFSAEQIYALDSYRSLLVNADQVIMPANTSVKLCNTEFGIIHTPGHSPDHLSISTPDRVLYLGDALLTENSLHQAKLPYFFSIKDALHTLEQLKKTEGVFDYYIVAHRGIYSSIHSLIDTCISEINQRTDTILSLIVHPMTVSEIIYAVCSHFGLLSSRFQKAAYYERNIRTYIDYLTDIGKLEAIAANGVAIYRPASRNY